MQKYFFYCVCVCVIFWFSILNAWEFIWYSFLFMVDIVWMFHLWFLQLYIYNFKLNLCICVCVYMYMLLWMSKIGESDIHLVVRCMSRNIWLYSYTFKLSPVYVDNHKHMQWTEIFLFFSFLFFFFFLSLCINFEKTIAFIFLEKSTLKNFLKWFLLKLSVVHLWFTDD